MRATLTAAVLMLAVLGAVAAPAPYPVTVDSRNPGAPPIYAYQSNARTFRATFTDGTNVSPVTGYTPYMVWATNSTAAGVATASVSVVSAATGVVDFTFAATNLNYTPGRYVYEVGVSTNGAVTTYRTGTFILYGAPGASSAMTAWTPTGETLQSVCDRGNAITDTAIEWRGVADSTNQYRAKIYFDGQYLRFEDCGIGYGFGTSEIKLDFAGLEIVNGAYTSFSNMVQAIINAQP